MKSMAKHLPPQKNLWVHPIYYLIQLTIVFQRGFEHVKQFTCRPFVIATYHL
jgi:hypothetical protein